MLCRGCKLCAKGSKMVVFITGLCSNNCFYCPLGDVKGRDVVFANERPVLNNTDLITEAESMYALGAGITGGEPLLVPDRVIEYITLLKRRFGKEFHIHLYTALKSISDELLSRLESAGLDELRIHLVGLSDGYKPLINRALKFKFSVGIEVPVLPDKYERLKKWVKYLSVVGVDFINLNELEFNEYNIDALRRRGYVPKINSISSVSGSAETALKLGSRVHYCPAVFKDAVQFRERLKRTAVNVARDFELITPDGTILMGVVKGDKSKISELLKSDFYFNKKLNQFELNPLIAKKLAKKFNGFFDFSLVEYYPTHGKPAVNEYSL